MINILWTKGETCPILVFLYQQHLVQGSQIGGLARVVNAFITPRGSKAHVSFEFKVTPFLVLLLLTPDFCGAVGQKVPPVQPKFTFVLLLHENIGFLDQTTSFSPPAPSPHPTHCCIVGGKLCHSLNHIV